MSGETTPNGTRGVQRPRMSGPLVNILQGIAAFFMRLMGMSLITLITTGAKSGKERTTMLGKFADGENSWLVTATNAGSARNPDWYYNLMKNPDKVWIKLGNQKMKVQPETLQGSEREAAWQRIVATAPSYGAYQKKTVRQIPVIRLRILPEP
jgi:deazaflavin-dependent oxidoreductase (nitroreductase family)